MLLCFKVLTTAFVLLGTLAVDLRGRQLLEIDGIELHGNEQLVLSGGGTCNVLESDTSYEKRKGNHGAPMDIWRLDFSVHNGSGRWLDHLVARFQIDAEWPECTNWDVPGKARIPQLLEWAGSIGHIQESGRNVVAPGQTLAHTPKFFIVLRGDPEPRFSNWSMDFDFGAGSPPVSGSPASAPTVSAEQETLFWQSIMNSTNPADFEAYLRQFPSGVFRALAENRLAALGDLGRDLRATRRFPAEADPQASGGAARAPASGQPFRPDSGTICASQGADSDCWMELASHPGCHLWADDGYHADRPVTWTGACSGGLASGSGTLKLEWVSANSSRVLENERTGLLRSGKKHGHWVEDNVFGGVEEGPYVDGVRHGDWVLRNGDRVEEGPYKDGKKHGHWVEDNVFGGVEEGPYVDGVRHGDWVLRNGDRVEEGPYKDGKKHGHWVEDNYWGGRGVIEEAVHEGEYVDGKRHGRWIYRLADGTTRIYTFGNGERQ